MLSPIITPIMTPIMNPIVGVGDLVPSLAFIYNGALTSYAFYTRFDVAYGIGPDNSPVEVAQDVLPTDVSDGARQALFYAGTNDALYSEDFIQLVWLKTRSSISSNITIAPDGKTTADKLVENTDNASHFVNQDVTLDDNTDYTYSVYAKKAERELAIIRVKLKNNTLLEKWVDLTDGSVLSGSATDFTSEYINNGWYRFTLKYNSLSGVATPEILVYTATTDGVFTTPGDGISGIYVWGAMLSDCECALPYIPTGASAVTVNQPTTSLLAEDIDKAFYRLNGTSDRFTRNALTELCKDCAFTVAMQINATDVTTEQLLINNIVSSSDLMAVSITAGTLFSGIYDGVSYFAKKSGSISIGQHSIILTFNGTDTLKLYLDGVELTSTGSPGSSINTGLSIGSRNDSQKWFNGDMFDVRVFDRVITSDERVAYQNGEAINNPVLFVPFADYRRDTFVEDFSGSGYHLTSERPVNELIVENESYGYDIGLTARKPWISGGTQYGISGLFNGVGGADATGATAIEEFRPATVSVRQDLLYTSNSFAICYLDTDGKIKLTDGTNTAETTSALVASDTIRYNIFPRHAADILKMWITLETYTKTDGIWTLTATEKGAETTFAGVFPDIGNRLFYYFDESDLHGVTNVGFSDQLPYDYVYKDGVLLVKDGEPVIFYR